jgi:hypothetical protein
MPPIDRSGMIHGQDLLDLGVRESSVVGAHFRDLAVEIVRLTEADSKGSVIGNIECGRIELRRLADQFPIDIEFERSFVADGGEMLPARPASMRKTLPRTSGGASTIALVQLPILAKSLPL